MPDTSRNQIATQAGASKYGNPHLVCGTLNNGRLPSRTRLSDSILLMQGDHYIGCNPATLGTFKYTREQFINTSPNHFSPTQHINLMGNFHKTLHTPDTQSLLKAMQCDMVQGYHLSRPMPAEQIAGLLGNIALP